jgi:hypothetical protein
MKIFEEEWKKAIEIKNLNKTDALNQLTAVQLIRFIEDLSRFSTSQYLYSIYLSILSSLSIDNRSDSSVSFSSSSPPPPPPPPFSLPHHYPMPPFYQSQQKEGGEEKEDSTRTILSNKKDKNERFYDYNSKINFGKDHHISFLHSLERYGVNLTDFTLEELIQIVDLILKMNYSGDLKFDRNNNILSIHSKDKNKSLIILTILLSLYFINLKYEIDITPKISEISDEIVINTFHIKYSKLLD